MPRALVRCAVGDEHRSVATARRPLHACTGWMSGGAAAIDAALEGLRPLHACTGWMSGESNVSPQVTPGFAALFRRPLGARARTANPSGRPELSPRTPRHQAGRKGVHPNPSGRSLDARWSVLISSASGGCADPITDCPPTLRRPRGPAVRPPREVARIRSPIALDLVSRVDGKRLLCSSNHACISGTHERTSPPLSRRRSPYGFARFRRAPTGDNTAALVASQIAVPLRTAQTGTDRKRPPPL
jgi:hypothetical protein